MLKIMSILLLVLLPVQFSWAAVATYCAHETQAKVEHFGHHEHAPQADFVPGFQLIADTYVQFDMAAGVVDLNCGHCPGTCGVMLTVPPSMPVALSSAPPSATLDESRGSRAPTPPERPQWLALA